MVRTMFSIFAAVFVACNVTVHLSGCSTQRSTSETSTKVSRSDSDRARYAGDTTEPRVVERTETTTEEQQDRSDGGLFSIAGNIIALPFRAVGSFLSAIL
jgi:uncharacterized protein YceK